MTASEHGVPGERDTGDGLDEREVVTEPAHDEEPLLSGGDFAAAVTEIDQGDHVGGGGADALGAAGVETLDAVLEC